ncbi:membrane protein [Mycobacterium Phage Nergal]|nr:membrane protein [Mycobacterium Phage Nergal]
MRLRYSDKGWLAVGALVVVIEVCAPRGELLSEGVDRYRRRWPIVTPAFILYLAVGHLLRVLPRRTDPLSLLASAAGR